MPEPRGTDIGGGANGASDQDAAGTGTGASFTGHAGRMASCVTGIGSTPGVTLARASRQISTQTLSHRNSTESR